MTNLDRGKPPHVSHCFKDMFSLDPGRPWLILGKGPSYQKILDFKIEMSKFNILAINETSKMPGSSYMANVNFFIDYDCYVNSQNALKQSSVIFMPYKPHLKPENPTIDSIEELVSEYEIRKFHWYSFDLVRSLEGSMFRESAAYPDFLPVPALTNSFEAAFFILSRFGQVKKIASVGVDGGHEYHPLFQTEKRPKSNNPNYSQFATVAELSRIFNVEYKQL